MCGKCAVVYSMSTTPVIYASPDCFDSKQHRFVCTSDGDWHKVLSHAIFAEDFPDRCPIDGFNQEKDPCLAARKDRLHKGN
jgi:hypothetical protein